MNGSDFLNLDAEDAPRGGRTDWLAASIRQAILGGVLPPGSPLPATRVLATDVGFARGTAAEAYRRLAEEGLLVARAGAGSAVAATVQLAPGHSASARRTLETGPADLIDLTAGLPDLTAFPRAAWLRAEKEVLATATAHQLGYAPPEGTLELRRELSGWLARSRGVIAAEDRIIVTAGVTGALSLLAQVLRGHGRTSIALEDPGADGNRRILDYWMPTLTPVPVDEEGIDVAALARTAADVVLVTPAHQYPTGVVLSPARRRDLLEWAGQDERLIVEDDYDAEYRYDRRPVRALQPLTPERVAYTASLSKTLAPALRLGWLVAPARLHAELVERRWATDLGSPALAQLILARLLRAGILERHLRLMRTRHRVRRDVAVAAIREHLPRAEITGVAAGLHLVLRLPDHLDDVQIATDAMVEGVAVSPLTRHRFSPGAPGLVLSYAAQPPARLESAMRTLARVIRSAAPRHDGRGFESASLSSPPTPER